MVDFMPKTQGDHSNDGIQPVKSCDLDIVEFVIIWGWSFECSPSLLFITQSGNSDDYLFYNLSLKGLYRVTKM